MRLTILLVPLLLAPVLPAADALVPVPPHPVPQVVAGFAVSPLAQVTVPTAIEFGPGDGDGPDLYATTLTGSVVRVALSWTSAGPVATGSSTYASGFSQPLGLVFDGAVLYVSDSHPGAESGRTDGRVTRVDPNGTRTVVVDGLPNGRHNTNNLRFAPDGRLAIANGNPNDNGMDPDADVFPYSGAILSVNVTEVGASPAVLRWRDANGTPIAPGVLAGHPRNADFAAKVQVVGYGFRNVYDVAYSPAGAPYTATNGADSPSSQDALYKISPGADHGFPRCYNVGAPGATGAGVTVEPNPLFPAASCAGVPPATALLGWHVCATGLDFPVATGAWAFPASFQDSVYVAECTPFFPETDKGVDAHNTGHKVVRVRLDANGDAVEVADFLTGLVLSTDVRFGPDGAMYVADAEGVLRVAPVPRPAAVPVEAVGFSFVSPVVVVPAGTAVEWNGRLLPHTVTTSDGILEAVQGTPNDLANADGDPDTFNQFLPQGGVYRHTFEEPGIYPYYCALHRSFGMVGAVVVV